jgi:outer membrane receptor for ferrienterochelin and colicins
MPASSSVSDRIRCGLLALAIIAASGPAFADTQETRARWHFVLPTLDGDHFVRSSQMTGPTLVNFWSRDCMPCIRELPRLIAFAHANPGWEVVLVATDAPQDAQAFLKRRNITLTTLRSGANVAGLMRSAGNRSGGLPFSVAMHRETICDTHLGELDDAQLHLWQTTACR